MSEQMSLSESMENYLETILDLEKTNKVARAKDIADELNLQRGTVSGALKVLKEKGLINYSPYSFITLTSEGKKIAELVDKAACRMEHAVDEDTLARLVAFLEYVNACPRKENSLLDSFSHYLETNRLDHKKCDSCIKQLKSIPE
jgi:DtxR family Mn-dependent transcriptional regulator